MQKIWFVIFSLLLGSSVNATEFKAYVQSFDEDIDLSTLDSKEVKTSDKLEPIFSVARSLPSPQVMDEHIKEAGLEQEIQKMDQMDKDLFYLKVKQKSLEYLEKKYSEIPLIKIKQLKIIMERK